MIDLHYWPTPNGHKMTMFFEETGIPYNLVPVNLQKNEQFLPDFLSIAPNNKMPAIVDHAPEGGGDPISIFESGAILVYLAEKFGKLLPRDVRGKSEVLQWLFWQVGGLGPMGGQTVFFKRTTEQVPFAIERFTGETKRLNQVLNKRLADRPFLAGDDYTIADIAAYPWAAPYDVLGLDLDETPHLERWLDAIAIRPATRRAYAIAAEINPNAPQPPKPRVREAG